MAPPKPLRFGNPQNPVDDWVACPSPAKIDAGAIDWGMPPKVGGGLGDPPNPLDVWAPSNALKFWGPPPLSSVTELMGSPHMTPN